MNGYQGNSGKGQGQLAQRFPEVDPSELTRLIIQALSDLGYQRSSDELRDESGLELDSPAINGFIECVRSGDFTNAELKIADLHLINDSDETKRHIVFLIKRQKFLELLYLENSTQEALILLRQEVHELTDTANIRALTSLLMNKDSRELQRSNGWMGDAMLSRDSLLNDISKFIDPNDMIPKQRLFQLLQQSIKYQQSKTLYQFGDEGDRISLYEDVKSNKKNFPDTVHYTLTMHEDEVWYVTFSHDGRYFASASADNHVLLYDAINGFSLLHDLSGHDKQVMHCSFSPDDSMLLTCSFESKAHLWNVQTGELVRTLSLGGDSRIWCSDWFPDGGSFVLGSPDKEIAIFDASTGEVVHRWEGPVVNDLKISRDYKLIAVTYDMNVEVWDLRTKHKVKTLELGQRLTSVSVSDKNPAQILINVSPNELQLWDWSRHILLAKYVGHKQEKFVLRSCFGYDERVILSGSEDGRIFMWNKEYGALLGVFDAHTGNSNCVCWNPRVKSMFASSGDDTIVKIWGPSRTSDSG